MRHLIPVLLSVTAYKPQTEVDNTPNVRDLNIPHLSCHQESTSVRAPLQSTANHLHYGLMLPDLKANHMHLFPILSSGQCHAARFIKKKRKHPASVLWSARLTQKTVWINAWNICKTRLCLMSRRMYFLSGAVETKGYAT